MIKIVEKTIVTFTFHIKANDDSNAAKKLSESLNSQNEDGWLEKEENAPYTITVENTGDSAEKEFILGGNPNMFKK